MAQKDGIRLGDRVVSTAIPGVFRVVGKRKQLLDIESDRGLRMTVREEQVRRVDGKIPTPSDA